MAQTPITERETTGHWTRRRFLRFLGGAAGGAALLLWGRSNPLTSVSAETIAQNGDGVPVFTGPDQGGELSIGIHPRGSRVPLYQVGSHLKFRVGGESAVELRQLLEQGDYADEKHDGSLVAQLLRADKDVFSKLKGVLITHGKLGEGITEEEFHQFLKEASSEAAERLAEIETGPELDLPDAETAAKLHPVQVGSPPGIEPIYALAHLTKPWDFPLPGTGPVVPSYPGWAPGEPTSKIGPHQYLPPWVEVGMPRIETTPEGKKLDIKDCPPGSAIGYFRDRDLIRLVEWK
jgi:hypothetical protein